MKVFGESFSIVRGNARSMSNGKNLPPKTWFLPAFRSMRKLASWRSYRTTLRSIPCKLRLMQTCELWQLSCSTNWMLQMNNCYGRHTYWNCRTGKLPNDMDGEQILWEHESTKL